MENLTVEQFCRLAASGFSVGFIAGFTIWGVRRALSFVSFSVTGRSTLGVD